MIEKFLDEGYGSCILKSAEVARILIDNWYYFDKQNYDLIAYVVMPNHVHVLIKTYENKTLSQIVHSWKSYTSKEILKLLSRDLNAGEPPALPAKIWQDEYWDRFIRDQNHFNKVVDYTHSNPVKAGLVASGQEWPWSSLNKDKKQAGES